jgi:uridine kinase
VRHQLVSDARIVLDLVLSRPPTLGRGRLVCIDGPAGSGKTTLATALEALADDGVVVHMDDLYEGWGGLATVGEQLATLLLPLAAGSPGHYRRWDWHASGWAETVVVDPGPLLVVEGVGSASAAYAALATVVVWVEAPADLRARRGRARDGDAVVEHWEQWTRDEEALFARERTRERADVVLDGSGDAPA